MKRKRLQSSSDGAHLEIVIVVLWKRLGRGIGDFQLVLSLGCVVNDGFRRQESRGFDEVQGVVPRQLTCKPEKRLLEVVIGFGRDVVVLQVFLAVKGDLLGFDFAVFDLDLVSGKDDGDVFADTGQVAVPVRHILVGDATRDIKHDNRALSLNVVSVAKATKLFLSGCIPNIKFNRTSVGVELQRMDFYTERRHVFLFEFSRQVALDKGGFAYTAITHQDQFEFRNALLRLIEKASCDLQDQKR